MKKFTLLLLLVLHFDGVFAQHTYILKFDEYESVNIGHYNKIKVFDLRSEKESLGFFKTGAFNRSADIITDVVKESVSMYTLGLIIYPARFRL